MSHQIYALTHLKNQTEIYCDATKSVTKWDRSLLIWSSTSGCGFLWNKQSSVFFSFTTNPESFNHFVITSSLKSPLDHAALKLFIFVQWSIIGHINAFNLWHHSKSKKFQWRWKATFLWVWLYFTRSLSSKIHLGQICMKMCV